jgi:hypothetical protein
MLTKFIKKSTFQNNTIEFTTEVTNGDEDDGKCRVQIQRELGDGALKDAACGDEAPKGFAGFCKCVKQIKKIGRFVI